MGPGLRDRRPKPLRAAEASDPRIRLALALLGKNAISSHVRINEIADELYISSSHLRHLFKKEVGMAPTHYVKVIRPQKAKELLENTFLSVKEVMAAVGFSDLSHFVRAYKAHFRVTPSQTWKRKPRNFLTPGVPAISANK
jgi:AraC-like DNA-binding protein